MFYQMLIILYFYLQIAEAFVNQEDCILDVYVCNWMMGGIERNTPLDCLCLVHVGPVW